MTARTGMGTIIKQVRALCNVGTADYSVAGDNYFSDDHIQAVLDEYQNTYRQVPLMDTPEYLNGAWVYKEYSFEAVQGAVEENATGSGWAVRNSAGTEAATADYTVNYQAKTITFDDDQVGTGYYLNCRAYDLERAAADVWERIAGFERNSVDWQSDNHRVAAQQRYEHAMAQAKQMLRRAKTQWVPLVRIDENPSP